MRYSLITFLSFFLGLSQAEAQQNELPEYLITKKKQAFFTLGQQMLAYRRITLQRCMGPSSSYWNCDKGTIHSYYNGFSHSDIMLSLSYSVAKHPIESLFAVDRLCSHLEVGLGQSILSQLEVNKIFQTVSNYLLLIFQVHGELLKKHRNNSEQKWVVAFIDELLIENLMNCNNRLGVIAELREMEIFKGLKQTIEANEGKINRQHLLDLDYQYGSATGSNISVLNGVISRVEGAQGNSDKITKLFSNRKEDFEFDMTYLDDEIEKLSVRSKSYDGDFISKSRELRQKTQIKYPLAGVFLVAKLLPYLLSEQDLVQLENRLGFFDIGNFKYVEYARGNIDFAPVVSMLSNIHSAEHLKELVREESKRVKNLMELSAYHRYDHSHYLSRNHATRFVSPD